MTDPTLGIWISENGEVVGAPDPTNLYRFVGDNPVNAVDPSGLGSNRSWPGIPKGYTPAQYEREKKFIELGVRGELITVDTTTRVSDLLNYFSGLMKNKGEGPGNPSYRAFSHLSRVAQSTQRRGIPGSEDVCVNWVSDVMNYHYTYLSKRPVKERLKIEGFRPLPDLSASTVGLMGSLQGQGPLLAASALFPGRRDFSINTQAWKSYRTGIAHQAIKVTIHSPNGPVVFYLDYTYVGGVGNGDHIFGPGDIPSSYMPISLSLTEKRPNSFLEDLLETIGEAKIKANKAGYTTEIIGP